MKRGEIFSALIIFLRVLYAAPMLLVFTPLTGEAQRLKKSREFLFFAQQMPIHRHGEGAPLWLKAQGSAADYMYIVPTLTTSLLSLELFYRKSPINWEYRPEMEIQQI